MKPKPNNESKIGPVISSLIIIIVLVVAALYYWNQHMVNEDERRKTIQQALGFSQTVDNQVTPASVIINSTSTNPAEIEQDLNKSLQ